MCSGMVPDYLIMRALVQGVDGILIAGCHPGDCHYSKGNVAARRRIMGLKQFLKVIGIGEDRVRLEWVSASEGPKMAQTVKDFTDKVRELGPNPFKAKAEQLGGIK